MYSLVCFLLSLYNQFYWLWHIFFIYFRIWESGVSPNLVLTLKCMVRLCWIWLHLLWWRCALSSLYPDGKTIIDNQFIFFLSGNPVAFIEFKWPYEIDSNVINLLSFWLLYCQCRCVTYAFKHISWVWITDLTAVAFCCFSVVVSVYAWWLKILLPWRNYAFGICMYLLKLIVDLAVWYICNFTPDTSY